MDESAKNHFDTQDQIRSTREHVVQAIQQLDVQVKGFDASSKIAQDANVWAFQRLEATMSLACDKLDQLNNSITTTATAHEILESLMFPEMKTRDTTITEAYEGTYEWIFYEQTTTFTQCLESVPGNSSERLFWIHGKAGSGKSTLMRFIETHSRTRDSLEKWAGNEKLLVATFYFWSSGHQLQRTLQGLLQSLLFQIFRQLPDIVQSICPERWSRDAFFHRHPDPWTQKELLNSFALIIDHFNKTPGIKVFALLDGLDEFEDGNKYHYTLIQWVHQLVACPSIKICVSSRPWRIFKDELAVPIHQQVQVHSLTRDDIKTYIQGTLLGDTRFGKRLSQEPRLEELVQELHCMADGVFLWVFLAIRSLLRGLSARDDIEKMFERLQMLPSDLNKFFLRTLDSIDEAHRVEAARMLLIVSLSATNELPLVGPLYFVEADRKDPNFVFSPSLQLVEEKTQRQWEAITTERIYNWCPDLIEVLPPARSLPKIWKFSHRTVSDFLRDSGIQQLLLRFAGEGFQARVALVRVWLAWLKTAVRADYVIGLRKMIDTVDTIMGFCRNCEVLDGYCPFALLDELDTWGSCWFRSAAGMQGYGHWSVLTLKPMYFQRDMIRSLVHQRQSMLSFAACFRLWEYIRHKLALLDDSKVKRQGLSILWMGMIANAVGEDVHLHGYLALQHALPEPIGILNRRGFDVDEARTLIVEAEDARRLKDEQEAEKEESMSEASKEEWESESEAFLSDEELQLTALGENELTPMIFDRTRLVESDSA